MARCGLPEAGAAGALQRHTGGQALGTEPGLAQASGNNAVQGCGGRQLTPKAGGDAGTVRGGSGRPRFSGLLCPSQCWREWTVLAEDSIQGCGMTDMMTASDGQCYQVQQDASENAFGLHNKPVRWIRFPSPFYR